jgi:hypothetical protein
MQTVKNLQTHVCVILTDQLSIWPVKLSAWQMTDDRLLSLLCSASSKRMSLNTLVAATNSPFPWQACSSLPPYHDGFVQITSCLALELHCTRWLEMELNYRHRFILESVTGIPIWMRDGWIPVQVTGSRFQSLDLPVTFFFTGGIPLRYTSACKLIELACGSGLLACAMHV